MKTLGTSFPNEKIPYREYELQIRKFLKEICISDEFLIEIKERIDFDEIIRFHKLRFVKEIACDEIKTEYDIHFDVPKNWWNTLLSQLGFKYKNKSISKKVTFVERLIYPNIPAKLFHESQNFKFLQFKKTDLEQ